MKTHDKQKFPVIYAFLLAVGLMSGLMLTPGDAQAEADLPITSVDAPAPVLEPTVENDNNDSKVLFDNTHGQTAGAADWVINGGFSDFGQAIADEGYYVKELRQTTPITYSDLQDYQVFVIPEANIPFKDSEQDAILQFVNNGGSVFFIGDHYNADRNLNRWDATEVFNGYRRGAYDDPAKGMSDDEANSEAMQDVSSSDWLSDNFGIRFRFNALGDAVASDVVSADESFGITEDVNTVAIHAGSTLAITDPTKVKGIVYAPEGVASWGNAVDQGVYFNGGRDEGAFVAISKLGKGKAAFIGDSSTVEDKTPVYVREESGASKTTYDGFKEQDDSVLLTNLIEWLATQEDYTTFEDQGITLDEESPLLATEVPEKSTEPETEPWSTPPSGYKWYDRTTFRPGSYGSGEMSVNPTFDVIHQDALPGEMQTFAIRITGEKLAPFASASDFRLGLYLDGGMQVGQFSLDGENWQSGFNYSDYFSLAADADGHAEKDIYVRVKSGVSGDAHLRLKQGKSNVFTNDVTIDPNAEPEPLPDGNSPSIPAPTDVDQVRTMGDNQQVTVQGTIVSEPGLFGAQGFYVQDDTGGIYVYQSKEGLHTGDVVSVTGKLATHNSELEITNPDIVKVDATDLPKPKVVNQLSEKNQGQLVQLNDVTVKNIHQAAGNAFEFDVVKGDQTTVVRIDSRTGISMDDFPYHDGDVIDITGISSIFNGVYQLKPRQWQDLHHTFNIADARALDEGQQVTVKGVVTTKTGLWGAKAFYIQDATGGIYVFTDENFNVKPGDVVKIAATTTSHDGELELTDITSLEKTGTSDMPKVQIVSPNDLANHQGELAKLEAVKVTDLHQADDYGTTEFTAVSDDGASVVVRLDNRTGTAFDDLPYKNGDVVFVTGISSQFKGTYQLKPRSIKDFAALDIDWIKDYVDKSNINPKGIKNAIHAKLNSAKKNPKHLRKLIDFVQHQPTKHIPQDVKDALTTYIVYGKLIM